MQTGSTCTVSGSYLSRCACHASVRLSRGAPVPSCPGCDEDVSWVLVRTEYVHPPKRGEGRPSASGGAGARP